MGSDELAEIVKHLKCVFDEPVRPAGDTNDKAVEVDLGHAFNRRVHRDDTERVGASGKAQGTETNPSSAARLIQRDIVTDKLEAHFVDRVPTQGFCVAEIDHVRAALA